MLQRSLSITAVAATCLVGNPVFGESYGEAEFRFGTSSIEQASGFSNFINSDSADPNYLDVSVKWQTHFASGFGVQVDADVSRAGDFNSFTLPPGDYHGGSLTGHVFANAGDNSVIGGFLGVSKFKGVGEGPGGFTSDCAEEEYLTFGLEGQTRLTNGAVINAAIGRGDYPDSGVVPCENNRRWDDAVFVSLSGSVPVHETWSLTGGLFHSEAIVEGNDQTDYLSATIGAEFRPMDSDWVFTGELRKYAVRNLGESDRVEEVAVFLGARYAFGGKRDDRKPLLKGIAREANMLTAIANTID